MLCPFMSRDLTEDLEQSSLQEAFDKIQRLRPHEWLGLWIANAWTPEDPQLLLL